MITQAELADKMDAKKSWLSKILSGKLRIKRDRARVLEETTGIPRLVWLDGDAEDYKAALEKIYGEINFTVGRPKK